METGRKKKPRPGPNMTTFPKTGSSESRKKKRLTTGPGLMETISKKRRNSHSTPLQFNDKYLIVRRMGEDKTKKCQGFSGVPKGVSVLNGLGEKKNREAFM